MFYKFSTTFLVGTLGFILFFNTSFAQTGGTPSIGWDSQVIFEDISGSYFTTGSVNVNNLSNPSALKVLILADSDDNFEPPGLSVAQNLGEPPANGVINFSIPGFPVGTYFLPVVVFNASYPGGIYAPFTNPAFQLIYGLSAPSAPEVVAPPPDPTPTTATPTGNTGFGAINLTSTIHNPLDQDIDLITFLQKLFMNIVKIALPFLVIFLVYSGFLFVEAQGNEEKLKKAKSNFLYVIIGGALILGAWVIATAIKGTVTELEAYRILETIINLV